MDVDTGGRRKVRSEINVTPLVAVVLVLLIIFMVVIPMLQMGHPVATPPSRGCVGPRPDQLIVRMDADGRTFVNQEEVTLERLPAKIRRSTSAAGGKLVFFAADGELPYGQVADFMDLCRNNGAENLGIVFDDIKPAGT